MRAHIRLGRILGVEVGLHYSWFIIAALIASSLAAHFQLQHPEWSLGTILGLALGTALLFFGTLLLHELSHAAVARARGLPVRSIVLFALGGVAQIEREAEDARTEFWVGVVGPLTSGAIAALCLGAARLLGWSSGSAAATPAQVVLTWLGFINLGLAVFNLLPGFPLDGGRVLRSLVWWLSGDERKATRIAARIGQGFAYVLMAFGLSEFFLGAGIGGLWLVLIGWFLLEGARGSELQAELQRTLKDVPVGSVMPSDCPVVEADRMLDDFVFNELLPSGRRCFAVVRGAEVEGIVTTEEVKQVEQPRWAQTRVGQVMHGIDTAPAVTPDTPLADVLEQMARRQVGEVAVFSGGRLQGILARDHVLAYLRSRAELDV